MHSDTFDSSNTPDTFDTSDTLVKGAPLLRIFLAEDSPMIQQRLTALLRRVVGVEIVGMAAGPDAAVSGIAATGADLAIIDLSLLGGSGLSVLQQLADWPQPIVKIVLTNFAIAPFRHRCMEAGADYFFDKTRDFIRVRDAIRDLAERRLVH